MLRGLTKFSALRRRLKTFSVLSRTVSSIRYWGFVSSKLPDARVVMTLKILSPLTSTILCMLWMHLTTLLLLTISCLALTKLSQWHLGGLRKSNISEVTMQATRVFNAKIHSAGWKTSLEMKLTFLPKFLHLTQKYCALASTGMWSKMKSSPRICSTSI